MIQTPMELDGRLSDDAVFYISGPMTGYEDYNYPQFNKVAAQLRSQGYEVLSPSEVDGGGQIESGEVETKPYSYYLKKAMEMMCQADAIIMLPEWTRSKGALAELTFMLTCGLPAFRIESVDGYGFGLVALDSDWHMGD